MSTLQTLDRGIQALEIVSMRGGLTIAELAAELGVARANCYRIVTTLESHGLVTRGGDGMIRIGGGVAALASRYWPGLVSRAESVLADLVEETGATGQFVVREGESWVVVLCVQPHRVSMQIGFPVGYRHALVGAPGTALLSGRPPLPDDPEEVLRARVDGYAISEGVLVPGFATVAAPIARPADRYAPEACLALTGVAGSYDPAAVAGQVVAAAAAVAPSS